ncbi:MAG: hypothetical protein Q9190_004275 [Brigantiaea leucoxantha]
MAETIRAGAGSNRVVAKSAEMQQTQAMHAVILGPIPPSVFLGYSGHHVTDILKYEGPGALIVFGKSILAADLLWIASVTTIKLSMLHLYISIFPIPSIRRLSYALMVFVIICGIAFTLEEFFICRPFAFLWNKTIPGGKCGDQKLAFLLPGVFNLISDLCIICLPMRTVWRLQMPTSKKFAVSFVFGIGIM